jgi:hypothetical protein
MLPTGSEKHRARVNMMPIDYSRFFVCFFYGWQCKINVVVGNKSLDFEEGPVK